MSHSIPPRNAQPHLRFSVLDSLFRYADFLGFGDLHIKIDEETGLKAIVAIHSLKRGPAIGGCRLYRYETVDKAVEDALRLAYMMSYKAAINNLPHGGAKSVLITPKVIKNKDAYFEKFGDFINELGGRYITAVDSGTSTAEMDIIARKTPYVTCTSAYGEDSDPSFYTALGVRRAIEAAIKFKMDKSSLEGISVCIQGAGHVGYLLAKDLKQLGCDITLTDIDSSRLQTCVDALKVNSCAPDEIYDIKADVFSPCALGAVINLKTIRRLNVQVIAGSANNQLAHHHYGALLQEKNILYAPDFLINAGGLIHVAVLYDRGDHNKSIEQIKNIYHTVYEIFVRAARENRATNYVAEDIARERLK